MLTPLLLKHQPSLTLLTGLSSSFLRSIRCSSSCSWLNCLAVFLPPSRVSRFLASSSSLPPSPPLSLLSSSVDSCSPDDRTLESHDQNVMSLFSHMMSSDPHSLVLKVKNSLAVLLVLLLCLHLRELWTPRKLEVMAVNWSGSRKMSQTQVV